MQAAYFARVSEGYRVVYRYLGFRFYGCGSGSVGVDTRVDC